MPIRQAQEAVQLLINAKHSQAAIGKRAGVSQATISRILSGELKDPAGSILIKLNEFADEVEADAAAQVKLEANSRAEAEPH